MVQVSPYRWTRLDVILPAHSRFEQLRAVVHICQELSVLRGLSCLVKFFRVEEELLGHLFLLTRSMRQEGNAQVTRGLRTEGHLQEDLDWRFHTLPCSVRESP